MTQTILPKPASTEEKPERGRLFYTLLTVMILLAVVPVTLTAWRLVSVNQAPLETNWKEYQMIAATSLVNETTLYLERISAQMDQIRMAVAWGGDDIGFSGMFNRVTETQFLQSYLGAEIIHISISDAEGTLRKESFIPGVDEALAAQMEMAFKEARAGRDYTSAPLLLELDGGARPLPLLVMARPLKIKGEVSGVISAIVSLDKVLEAAVKRARASGFDIYGVTADGGVFMHSDTRSGLRSLSQEHPLMRAFQASLRQSQTTPASNTFPYVTLGPDLKERDMVGTFVTLPRYQWGVLVEIPQKMAYSAVYDMYKNAAYVALVAVLIAAALAALMAQRLTAPLQELTAAAELIAKGDFSRRANVKSRNEIGILAETFNQMSSDMQAYIARLQHMSEENRKMFMGTVRVLAAAIDAKDPYTRGHSERVAQFSVAIAKHLGMGKDELDRVRVGALLHDVGKIGIEDSILGKPAPLTDEEFTIMQQHPEKGARIIAQIEQLRDIVAAIRYHHERWSGGGYPTGVSGEHIPVMGRIVAVADTFDAMTTERPYQKGMTFDYATAKIYELRGIKYDPKVVDALVKAYRAGDIKKGMRGSVLDDGFDSTAPADASGAVPALEI